MALLPLLCTVHAAYSPSCWRLFLLLLSILCASKILSSYCPSNVSLNQSEWHIFTAYKMIILKQSSFWNHFMSEASETQRRDVSFLRSSSKVSGKGRVRLRTLTGVGDLYSFLLSRKEMLKQKAESSVVWMSTQSFYIGSLVFKIMLTVLGRFGEVIRDSWGSPEWDLVVALQALRREEGLGLVPCLILPRDTFHFVFMQNGDSHLISATCFGTSQGPDLSAK